MPLFFALIAGIGALAGRSAEKAQTSELKGGAIGLVDQSHIIDFSLAESLSQKEKTSSTTTLEKGMEGRSGYSAKLLPYPSLEKALAELQSGRLLACYVIDPDYLQNGRVTSYTQEKGFFKDIVLPGRGALNDLLRASLIRQVLASPSYDRVLNPARIKEMKLDKQGMVVEGADQFQKMMSFFGPFGVALLLTISIFSASGYLLQSTSEEKQNRVIEVILSSVKPDQLLAGKMLGLGAAGLMQVALYVLVLIVPSMIMFVALKLSLLQLMLSLVYFLLGFLLFASIMASCGMIGNNLQESAQLSTVFTLTSMIPMMLMGILMQNADGTLAKALSYIPLTAPVTMLIRTSMAKPPVLDYVLSLLSLVVGILLAIRVASKIFRFASLMYGKRPTLPEIFRWVRES
jgi:ABC-2 type transport system permease protein